jgi:hypothetical protein
MVGGPSPAARKYKRSLPTKTSAGNAMLSFRVPNLVRRTVNERTVLETRPAEAMMTQSPAAGA